MREDPRGLNLRHGELTRRIIGCAMRVHRILGPGFPENVYHRALCQDLLEDKIHFESERAFEVWYGKVLCGEFRADILAEDKVILELKAVDGLCKAHEAQCLSYLKASGKDLALLLNFGEPSLKVKRIIL